MAKKITLLGSTGSIGTQSLDVVRAEGYEVFGLSAHRHVDQMLQQIEEFHPKAVCMTDPEAARTLDAALADIESQPHPLALYLFSEDKAVQRKVLDRCHFGGGCLNDTIIHLATSAMPFGGVGESGMGGYHGKAGFEAFSHLRSIVDKKTWLDMPVRYQPYTKQKDKMLRFFLQ